MRNFQFCACRVLRRWGWNYGEEDFFSFRRLGWRVPLFGKFSVIFWRSSRTMQSCRKWRLQVQAPDVSPLLESKKYKIQRFSAKFVTSNDHVSLCRRLFFWFREKWELTLSTRPLWSANEVSRGYATTNKVAMHSIKRKLKTKSQYPVSTAKEQTSTPLPKTAGRRSPEAMAEVQHEWPRSNMRCQWVGGC